MLGATALMQRNPPKKLVSMTWRKRAIGASSIGPPPAMPALLTRMSIRPCSAITLDCCADGTVVIDIKGCHDYGEFLIRDELAKLAGCVRVSHRRNDGVSGARERHCCGQSNAGAGAGNQGDRHYLLHNQARSRGN